LIRLIDECLISLHHHVIRLSLKLVQFDAEASKHSKTILHGLTVFTYYVCPLRVVLLSSVVLFWIGNYTGTLKLSSFCLLHLRIVLVPNMYDGVVMGFV
jgi:hypothetical protein